MPMSSSQHDKFYAAIKETYFQLERNFDKIYQQLQKTTYSVINCAISIPRHAMPSGKRPLRGLKMPIVSFGAFIQN